MSMDNCKYIGEINVLSFRDYIGKADAYDIGLKDNALLIRYEEFGEKRSAICKWDYIQYSFKRSRESEAIKIWNEVPFDFIKALELHHEGREVRAILKEMEDEQWAKQLKRLKQNITDTDSVQG